MRDDEPITNTETLENIEEKAGRGILRISCIQQDCQLSARHSLFRKLLTLFGYIYYIF